MKATTALRAILILTSSTSTVSAFSAASTPDSPPSLEDTLHHNELGFAFNHLPRQVSTGQELQAFFSEKPLGGASSQPIVFSGNPERPFEVEGDTFPDFPTAANRVCDKQKNACAEMANDASEVKSFRVSDCDEQRGE
ncbi:hypothetical protein B0H65DRAFT_335615 [Neurospora tetraspora]|uniref:Uncharacterized protein n=1 Tax=Neurospora tetraspora TaxID=94610 RepID=A0AAE0J0X4_9PEZI|nr:hypothetical protein B0H65DRAFT_335615 [Neurospora tetraspora]